MNAALPLLLSAFGIYAALAAKLMPSSNSALDRFIELVPKAELHVHVEVGEHLAWQS